MAGEMHLRIWDVDHGACAMLHHTLNGAHGRLAMVDAGETSGWRPSKFIQQHLNCTRLDYLFITNADQDHMSDLQGLWDAGIDVTVVHRNPDPPGWALRIIKEQGGVLTSDAERYLQIHNTYNSTITEPFNDYMGGITMSAFFNPFPRFKDTNNLSLAVFFQYAGFKILFPGDLERNGWLAMLEQPQFRYELAGINVLVASHHGRENGYCPEVFDYCRPQVVVMSDKAIVHDTQEMSQTYRNQVLKNHPNGVIVATTNKRRHVLTTRRDGYIHFEVNEQGSFIITTEKHG